MSTVDRLTEPEYARLNEAVDSDLPRTNVGEVALAIVNERIARAAAPGLKGFPRTSGGSTEGEENAGTHTGAAHPDRSAELREPRGGGAVLRPEADGGGRGEAAGVHPGLGTTENVRRPDSYGTPDTTVARVEALAEEWERSSARQTRMYGRRLRRALGANR